MSARKEYLKNIYKRYWQSSKKERGRILDEFCKNTGYARKYATRILNAPFDSQRRMCKKRSVIYTNEDVHFLQKIWRILDCPCGQRLQPVLQQTIDALRRHRELDVPRSIEARLLTIAPVTIDRKLASFKKTARRMIQGTTKPGSLLKRQIPISLSRWDETVPGFLEVDLVAHCGSSAAGDFVSTLNITDMVTQWTESVAILGKSQRAVIQSLDDLQHRLPFPLRGIDPDNGAEFINWNLLRYCAEREVEFTRSRPYHKNDNAHIEQKNWTHVRKIVGYRRLETMDAVIALNELYAGPLRLYMNFFQPTMKLIKKDRIGGQLKRVYDIAQTPYQRVLASDRVVEEEKEKLRTLYQTLNPAQLKRDIERLIRVIQKMPHVACPLHSIQSPAVTFSMTQRMPVRLHF